MKNVIKKLFLIGCFIALLGVAFYFVGATFIVVNQSGHLISDITIDYGRGSFSLTNIANNESRKKFLGKIGEGTSIRAHWKYADGSTRGAEYSIYFYSLSLFTELRMVISADGSTRIYENEFENDPSKTW